MSDDTIKTALVVNEGMPGTMRVLREYEKQKDRLAKVYLLGELLSGKVTIPDSADAVIFGAWDNRYLNVKFHYQAKRFVLFTSPISQAEMEPFEINAIIGIKELVEKGKLDGVWFGSPNWLNLFPKDDKKFFYSPYPISLKRPPLKEEPDELSGAKGFQKHVSMFGPIHMRKNFYNQVAAVKAADAVLHTNKMDEIQMRFCQAMGVSFIPHSWMPEKEYFATIQSMDMGLQVSHCGVESQSYVWIDHLMMNVPCLTSMGDAPAQLHCLPNDIHRMEQKIREGFQFEDWREWVRGYAENRNRLFNKVFSERSL